VNLTAVAVRRWQATLVVFLLLAVLGLTAFISIPRSVDPHFPFALTVTTVVLPGADAADVEETIAKPLEEALQSLDHVREIRSTSSEGVAVIVVEFEHGTDADQALDRTVRVVQSARDQLPQGIARIAFRRPRPTEAAVLQLALVSDSGSWRRMAKYAQDLRERLNVVAGVRSVTIDGAAQPEVRVAIDAGRLGLPRPPAVPGTEHLRPPMDEVNLRAGGRIAAIHQAGACAWESYDAASRTGLLLAADAAAIMSWEWASPLKRLMAWATHDESFGLLHGAVIGDARGGVMLAGTTGVGKSTTTAAALLAGLSSAGDDLTMVARGPGDGLLAHAAFDSVKLSEDTLRLVGATALASAEATGPGLPKHILRLSGLGAGRLAATVPLRAILLPRLAGGPRSVITAGSKAAALKALGPVSGFVMRVTPDASFALAARVVRQLPCFVFDLGDSPAEAARRIATFIDRGEPG
jgi:hypothetical protein